MPQVGRTKGRKGLPQTMKGADAPIWYYGKKGGTMEERGPDRCYLRGSWSGSWKIKVH